mmetsp:Transcript_73958/g.117140  ORF Transcript_73958/g.117140 Transcript_73958/m.117140 type:complete len:350 (-) Transcript_73958:1207-2256(-)
MLNLKGNRQRTEISRHHLQMHSELTLLQTYKFHQTRIGMGVASSQESPRLIETFSHHHWTLFERRSKLLSRRPVCSPRKLQNTMRAKRPCVHHSNHHIQLARYVVKWHQYARNKESPKIYLSLANPHPTETTNLRLWTLYAPHSKFLDRELVSQQVLVHREDRSGARALRKEPSKASRRCIVTSLHHRVRLSLQLSVERQHHEKEKLRRQSISKADLRLTQTSHRLRVNPLWKHFVVADKFDHEIKVRGANPGSPLRENRPAILTSDPSPSNQSLPQGGALRLGMAILKCARESHPKKNLQGVENLTYPFQNRLRKPIHVNTTVLQTEFGASGSRRRTRTFFLLLVRHS